MSLAEASSLQLPELMRRLAQTKSATATFVEKKYIAVLDQPVVSTGELSFVAPDRLEKRTLTPKAETLTLVGDTLTMDRAGHDPLKLNIKDHPAIGAFVESIRGTLAGDLSGLRTFYTLGLTGSSDQWQLTLTPKGYRLRHLFEHIVIRGSQTDIRTIELDQSDGDHSVMAITPGRIVR